MIKLPTVRPPFILASGEPYRDVDTLAMSVRAGQLAKLLLQNSQPRCRNTFPILAAVDPVQGPAAPAPAGRAQAALQTNSRPQTQQREGGQGNIRLYRQSADRSASPEHTELSNSGSLQHQAAGLSRKLSQCAQQGNNITFDKREF